MNSLLRQRSLNGAGEVKDQADEIQRLTKVIPDAPDRLFDMDFELWMLNGYACRILREFDFF